MTRILHPFTPALRLLVAALLLAAAAIPLPAKVAYRPPDMDKEIFDTAKIDIDRFDRSGLVGGLLSIARDFDDDDKVDYELRAHALAIAGRLDKDSDKIETCLAQLRDDGETIGEPAKKDRVMRRLKVGIKALLDSKDTEANQVCAAYVADVALRFDPDSDDLAAFEEFRDDLAKAGHEPDWSGLLGNAVRHPTSPFDEPVFVKAEVKMPGGKAPEFAQPQSHILGLVVQQLPSGAHAGAASSVNATALPEEGVKGLLFTFNQDVGPMMGGCLEEVIKFLRIRYAKQQEKIPEGYKIEIGFQDKYQLKDGPSAATVFTLLLDSLFSGEQLDEQFAATGDITADGMVQNIGGVAAKIRGATKRGCKIVGIPAGNASGIEDVLVMDGPEQLLDIQIFTMKDFDEAYAISRKDKSAQIKETLAAFQEVATVVKEKGFDSLKLTAVQERLDSVVGKMPNHLSAKLLLDYGRGKAPSQLSVGGTFQEIELSASGVFRPVGRMMARGEMKIDSELRDEAKEATEKLEKIAGMIDPRMKDYHAAMLELTKMFIDGRKDGETDEELSERIKKALERVQTLGGKLREDPEIMEEIMG